MSASIWGDGYGNIYDRRVGNNYMPLEEFANKHVELWAKEAADKIHALYPIEMPPMNEILDWSEEVFGPGPRPQHLHTCIRCELIFRERGHDHYICNQHRLTGAQTYTHEWLMVVRRSNLLMDEFSTRVRTSMRMVCSLNWERDTARMHRRMTKMCLMLIVQKHPSAHGMTIGDLRVRRAHAQKATR